MGKGSRYRPVNGERFRSEYDRIFLWYKAKAEALYLHQKDMIDFIEKLNSHDNDPIKTVGLTLPEPKGGNDD